jgi:tetratricopeptide (TPR) repeat protein
MKKTFLTIVTALLVSVVGYAQQATVNVAAYQKKIEKSNAEIANEKKAAKASTWMKRAELMVEVENAYTAQIFEQAPLNLVMMKIGNPATQEGVVIGRNNYIKLGYGAYDVYADETGQFVMGWNVTEPIYENAIDEAIVAFKKVMELNPKLAKKVNLGFIDLQNALRKTANSKFFLQDYKAASDYFERAYELSIIPEAGLQVDDASIYNAGYLAFFAGDYERSIEKLRIAESHGYYAEGSIYNVLYNAYVSAYRDNKEKMTEAKEFLQKALVEFPTNSEIVSCMTDVYLVLGESPEPMIDILKGAIDADPQNPQLKIGLGAVYAELKKFDEAIAMFDEAIALEPGNINLYLNKAYTYTRKGDDLNKIANDMNWNDENRNGVIVSALEAYAASIEPFEQAHQLNPNDINTVEFLKSICFQVRNVKPEYMEKYNHYNALFKEMRGM